MMPHERGQFYIQLKRKSDSLSETYPFVKTTIQKQRDLISKMIANLHVEIVITTEDLYNFRGCRTRYFPINKVPIR